MPIIPMPNQPVANYDIALSRVQMRADGSKVWPEIFTAQIQGYRPFTASVSVPSPADRPHPLVILIHGGGWWVGHPHFTNPCVQAMDVTATLNAAGYAVAAISYRLSSEKLFPAQIQDCKAAVRYLRHHAQTFGIDPERFAVLGESAGGHLALLLGQQTPAEFDAPEVGAEASSEVNCVVAWYPITDFTTLGANDPPGARYNHHNPDSPATKLLGAMVSENPKGARAASPITHVSARSVPTQLIHGTADTIVACDQSRLMAKALDSAGVANELIEIEGAQHCFFDVEITPIMPYTLSFLNKHLLPDSNANETDGTARQRL